MAMLCICGICIPYSSLLPILLVLFRPLWNFISKYFGWENDMNNDKKNEKKSKSSEKSEKSEKNDDKKTQKSVDTCCSSATTTECNNNNNAQESSASSPTEKESKSNLITLTEEMDWKELITSSRNIICRYTAKWCKPCQAIAPIFYEIAQQHPEITFVTVDVDENEEVFQSLGILGIPHLQFYVNGELKSSLSGNNNNAEAIQEVISEFMK